MYMCVKKRRSASRRICNYAGMHFLSSYNISYYYNKKVYYYFLSLP